MYQVMETTRIWLETRWKLSHTNIAQMALSMCSSRYCSTFAHLFLYFWTIIVFWGSLTLSFYFLIFFFTKEHKRSNHRKYKLKQVKGVACGKFKRRAQNWQKTYDHEKRISWPVFGQNKIFWTRLFHFCFSLFLSSFGLSIFFGILWLCPFISLIFFLHLEAQKK